VCGTWESLWIGYRRSRYIAMFAMTIRKAKTADLPAIAVFDSAALNLKERIDALKSAIVQGRCWVYADAGQPPRGYAILQHDFFDYPFIKLVYVRVSAAG